MQNKLFKNGATALFLGLSGMALTAPAAHAQFGKISEEEEIQAGRQSAAQAVKEYGRALPQSDPRARRVARLGAMFAAQSKRRNIPFSYTVLENDKVLNAFAAPGGPIFVTTKLISTTSNDAELAYVLGHETGHIERKHIVNAVAKQQKVGLGVGILGAILGRGKGGSSIGTIANGAFTFWQRGYSRNDENDADTYGVEAMSRLGFDPRAAVSMLGKLGGGNSSGLSKYLATHPSPESRQTRVTDLIRQKNLLQIAQQSGGARLSMGSGSDDSVYRPTNSPSNSTTYPDDAANSENENRNDSGIIRLGAPLRLVNSGNARIVMAPVALLARYAGGSAQSDGDSTITVARDGEYLRMQVGATRATLSGREVRLSVAPTVVNGSLYAPLGSVVAGLGGSAAYDQGRNAVRVDFEGRGGYLPLQ